MKSFAAILGLAAVATAHNSSIAYTTYVTDTVTVPCPSATVVTTFGKTYTVTEATTLTITDCPCTVSKPMEQGPSTILYSACPSDITTPAMPAKTPVAQPVTTYTNPLTVIYSTNAPAASAPAGGAQAGGPQAGGAGAGGAGAGGAPGMGSSASGYAQATGTSAPYSTFSGAAMANKVGMGALGVAAALAALPFAL